MENISRAIIIAGGVLVAILVLTLFTVVIARFGSFSSDVHTQMSDTQIGAYNQNFYRMNGRINITSQEIATIINFAKTQNDDRGLSYNNAENSPYYIDIIIDNVSFLSKYNNEATYKDKKLFEQRVNEFLKSHNLDYFSCNARASVQNGVIISGQKCKIKVNSTNDDINVSNVTGLVNSIKFTTTKAEKDGIKYNVINEDYFSIE